MKGIWSHLDGQLQMKTTHRITDRYIQEHFIIKLKPLKLATSGTVECQRTSSENPDTDPGVAKSS